MTNCLAKTSNWCGFIDFPYRRAGQTANECGCCDDASVGTLYCRYRNAHLRRVVSPHPNLAERTRYATSHPTCHILASARQQPLKAGEASRARMREGPECTSNSAHRFSESAASAWARLTGWWSAPGLNERARFLSTRVFSIAVNT